jgi:hypothetical protein
MCHFTSAGSNDKAALEELLERMEQAGKRRESKIKTHIDQSAENFSDPPALNARVRGSERSLEVSYFETAAEALMEAGIKDMPPISVTVDGRLTDSLWKKAAVSSGFWCSLESRPPTDQTEVRVARDKNYLYFGFRIFDSHPEKVAATKTVRDTGLGFDDSITVQLDTFFNRRDISSFSLNPLGTQIDEIAGGRSSKVEWKGDWLGAATRTEYGWSAEFAIPFRILNYQAGDTIFGLNFKRYQSRTKEYSWWADITPQNHPEEMGRLSGLELPESTDKKAWTFMPFVLAGKNIPDKEGDIEDELLTGGIDIRYQPRPDLTGMISLNPDFSQVEQAVTDISFSYTEKEVEDNRPFFTEGARYFADEDDGNEYFYSNRAADFDYGAKGFGRFGQTKFGLLGTSAPNDRRDFVGRMLFEIDDTHSAVGSITATDQREINNLLGVAQIDGRQKNGFEYALDAAISDTQTDDDADPVDGQGSHMKGSLGWKWDYWYVNGNGDYYDVDYFPALGLLDEDLPGTRAGSVSSGYYKEQSGRFWRTIDGYAGYRYRETEDGQLQNRKWYTGGSVEFDCQIRTSFYAEEGPYRPVDDQRGEFEDTANNDRYYSTAIDLNTRSSVFSCGAQYDWGRLGGDDYEYQSVYAWTRPVQVLYLQISYERTDSFGTFEQTVVNGSWEITPEDSLGGRYIYYEDDFTTDEYVRLTYGRKARQGLDIFIVYDKEPYSAEQYSLKLVYSF